MDKQELRKLKKTLNNLSSKKNITNAFKLQMLKKVETIEKNIKKDLKKSKEDLNKYVLTLDLRKKKNIEKGLTQIKKKELINKKEIKLNTIAINKINKKKSKLDIIVKQFYNLEKNSATNTTIRGKLTVNTYEELEFFNVLEVAIVNVLEVAIVNEEVVIHVERNDTDNDLIERLESFTGVDAYRISIRDDNNRGEEKLYNTIKKYIDLNRLNFEDFNKLVGGKKNKQKVIKFVRIFFRDANGDGLVRTLRNDNFITFEEFKFKINAMKTEASKVGSDQLEYDAELFYNVFDILLYDKIEGHGSTNKKNMLFKTNKTESKKRLCGYECIKNLLPDTLLTEQEYIKDELFKLDNMAQFLKNKGVGLIGDCICLCDEIRLLNEKIHNRTKVGSDYFYLYKLELDDVVINEYMKNECGDNDYNDDGEEKTTQNKYNKYIVYNINDEHYEWTNKLELDEIYINMSGDYCKKIYNEIKNEYEYILLFSSIPYIKKQKDHNFIKRTITYTRYLMIDYETVIDFKNENINTPYSLALFDANDDILIELDRHDKEKNTKEINKIIEENTKFFYGSNVSEQLLKYMQQSIDTVYKIITYNGSNFDNLIFYNDLVKLNYENITKIFFMGNTLLNFTMAGRHDFFDLRKHLTGSLKKNCENFKINCVSKIDFSHDKAQELYDNGELINYIETNDEIKKYNIYDVVSLGLLFHRYRDGLSQIESLKQYTSNLTKYKTIGGLIMRVFKDHTKANNIETPILNDSKDEEINKRLHKYYDSMINDKVAGRVELFNGVQKVTNKLYSMDVCSLYPYVMSVSNVYYPTGEIIEIEKYEDKPEGLIGFFYCDIDQSYLINNDLALMYPKKTKIENEWDTKEIIKNIFISSITIESMELNKVIVTKHNGIYFTEKIESYKMFEPLLHIMNEKNKQDIYKKSNDKKQRSLYNESIREVCKLLSNSLSGKLIEGLHLDKTEIITNRYDAYFNNYKDVNFITMSRKNLIISHKKDKAKCMTKSKPVYIGVLIYDYARDYMYNNIIKHISRKNKFYTDTDSLKINEEGFKEWMKATGDKIVPHWKAVEKYDIKFKTHKIYEEKTKVYGSFENEYKESNNLHYFMAKKSYLSLSTNNDFLKMSLKGIGKRDAFIKEGDIKNKTNKELNEIYKNAKKIDGNELELFDELYTKKTANILTFSMKRIINNSKKNKANDEEKYIDNFSTTKSLYILKKLNIKN